MHFAIDWTRRIDFDLLRQERAKSLNEQIKAYGLDGLLCFKAENIRYMTGYRPLWWPISFLTRNAGAMALDKDPIMDGRDRLENIVCSKFPHKDQTHRYQDHGKKRRRKQFL